MATGLPDLRKRLAAAQIGARNEREDLRVIQARAETRAIEAAGGEKQLGANAESRERALLIALADDAEYQGLLNMTRELERLAADLEAELEGERDIRREQEWAIRLRLAAALDGRGIQSDADAAEIADEDPFAEAADAEAGDRVIAELREEAVKEAAEDAKWDGSDLAPAAGAIDPDAMPF
jgi:hypothetical protein